MSTKHFHYTNLGTILPTIFASTVTACRRSCSGNSENSQLASGSCPYQPHEIRNLIGFIILGISGAALLGLLFAKIFLSCRKFCLIEASKRKKRRKPGRNPSDAHQVENIAMYAASSRVIYSPPRNAGSPMARTPVMQRSTYPHPPRSPRLTTPRSTNVDGRVSPYRGNSAYAKNVKFEDAVIKAKVNDYLRKLGTNSKLNGSNDRRRGGRTGAEECPDVIPAAGRLSISNISPSNSTSSLHDFDTASITPASHSPQVDTDEQYQQTGPNDHPPPPVQVLVEDADGEFNAGAPGEESEEFFKGGDDFVVGGGFDDVDD